MATELCFFSTQEHRLLNIASLYNRCPRSCRQLQCVHHSTYLTWRQAHMLGCHSRADRECVSTASDRTERVGAANGKRTVGAANACQAVDACNAQDGIDGNGGQKGPARED
jgi:hypothetical protein